MSKKKNQLRINLEYCLFLALVTSIRLLPLSWSYWIASKLADIVFVFDRRHRLRTIQHMLHAGIVETEAVASHLAKRNWRQLAMTFVDIFKMNHTLNESNIHEHVKFSGSEKTHKLVFESEKSPSIIALTAHYGNWEIIGISYTLMSGNDMISVMRDFDNHKVGDLITKNRITEKHSMCSKKNAVKPLLRALRKGASAGILTDQHASTSEGVEVEFFGHPVRAHASPAMLHLKTGAPIVVSVLRRVAGEFKFEMVCRDPIIVEKTSDKEADIREVVQRYISDMEALIRECPEQWLWAHRRFLDLNRKR